MTELLSSIPPDVFMWLSPLLFFFLIVYIEQRNALLKKSIDELTRSLDKLTSVLDKQETVLDDIGERLVKLETEFNLLATEFRDSKGGGRNA